MTDERQQLGELIASMRALRDEVRLFREEQRDRERLTDGRLGALERWRAWLSGGLGVVIFVLGMIIAAWPWRGLVR